MKNKKPSFVPSAEYRRQLAIGAAIADRLPQLHSNKEVAKKLGMSIWGLRKIECLALYKLQTRLGQLLRDELADQQSSSTNIGKPKPRTDSLSETSSEGRPLRIG